MGGRSHRRAASLVFAVSLAFTAGCGEGAPDRPERHARRFVPFERQWRLESQVPREPQETPKMVIWEVSELAPDGEPTPDQRGAARDLIARCERAAREHGWYDFQQGLADGFTLLFADRRHYVNKEFVFDDAILDPDRPEFLMYYGTPAGKQLVGFMFYVRTPDEWGPQIGGPQTIWHYHVWNTPVCLERGMLSLARPDDAGRCERGTPTSRSPEMIHVWLVDHPKGPFATSMWLEAPLMKRLLEKREARWRREADEKAEDASDPD